MKHLLLVALIVPSFAQAQKAPEASPAEEPWQQFTVRKKGSDLYGYKDAGGQIRVPARFGNFAPANTFRHIIAVHEAATHNQYYLLKNGRQLGCDSVFMADYTFDCESEGKIRFFDRKRNRMGFFDSQGHVAILASYNAVTPFRNGLAVALVGARAECLSGERDTMRCEHPGWVGGRTVLLNQRNEIVIDSLDSRKLYDLNWYSLQVNSPAIDTATTVIFRAANGDRYSFLNYEKEFKHWLYSVFLPTVRTGDALKVAPLCFSDLAVAAQPFRGWPHFSRDAFVHKFYQPVLRPKLSIVQRGVKNVSISSDLFNTLIFDGPDFKTFLTDCGQHFEEKYPTFNLIISYAAASGKRGDETQEHFMFIRTDAGYRLYCVGL